MSKKKCLAALIVLSIPGSFICFYATNLILSDVANMFYMTLTKDVISSIPIFMIAAEFVTTSICLLHMGLYPDAHKYLMCLNASVIAVFSIIGVTGAVLTGTVVYRSFSLPYPFPGATVITLIFHAVTLVLALLAVKRCHDAAPLEEARTRRAARGVQWILMVIFTYYAFDRFGAVLWMPFFVQLSTLSKTFIFYLSLLLPICLLLSHCRYRLGMFRNIKTAGILCPLIYLAADVLFFAVIAAFGVSDTQFIAAVSPAVGIERLISKPVITIAHFFIVLFPVLVNLGFALFKKSEVPEKTAVK